jgi:hypothetical protein
VTRWLVILLGVLLGTGLAAPSATANAVEGMTISGGDLPYPVRLAPSDEDSFKRRINTPPRLDERPLRATGPTYTIASNYWTEILARPNRPAIEDNATYYAESGIVRARYGGEDAWLALDIRQQGILERYIRLGSIRAIPQRPGVLDVMGAARTEELITLETGGAVPSPAQAGIMWDALAGTGPPSFLDPAEPPQVTGQGFWLVFGLREGRSVQLYYAPGPQPSLTDVFGRERYDVSPSLSAALAMVKPAMLMIDDRDSPGSDAWWPIMAAAGLACLGAAWWLYRHPLRLPFETKS